MSVLPRELASRYEVLEMMGEGGMGAVYKARHVQLDRVCVIKVVRAQHQKNRAARERFLGEARKGAQIKHPNVAAVLEFIVDSDDIAWLVMEYIDGKNLADVLESRTEPFDYRSAADIACQALAALACLHAKKLVHRDISPDNLMLTRDSAGKQAVILIDLGIAKSLEETAGGTGTGVFIGKWCYAPPEQFGNRVDTRSDIYAMGVVLYELLTKTLPIVGKDFASFYVAHQRNEPPRPFSETDPHGRVPESVRSVVLKALEKKPENRFQTADEFREGLDRAVGHPAPLPTTVRDAATPRATPVHSAARSQRRTRRAIGISAGGIILAVGGAILGRMLNWIPDPWPPAGGISRSAESNGTSGATVTVTDSPQQAPPTRTDTTPVSQLRDPNRAAAALTEGKKLADTGDLQGAYGAYDRATKADPDSAYAWANLGAAAAKLGKRAEAAEAYQHSLSIDPDNWLAHYNLGCLYARDGNRDEAYGHVERAVDQLRRHARSPSEIESFLESIRTDDALKELRNDRRFTALLATN